MGCVSTGLSLYHWRRKAFEISWPLTPHSGRWSPHQRPFAAAECTFSITSLLFEIFGGNSVISTIITLLEKCSFFQKHFSLLLNIFHGNVPEILRANVVLEIVKILGFGSVLIGIVQMLMEKKTFGVSYANIIKCRYPFYRQTFFIHLLATIMCIGFSAAGASEGALITLIIMLLGRIMFISTLWFWKHGSGMRR